jgi:LemA protein
MYIILVIIAVILLWAILVYNKLISLRNQNQEAWSGIDVQLKRRHNLIPNLIATVKGYQDHEAGVMDDVTKLRQTAMQAGTVADKSKAESALGLGLGKLIAVAENYPDLKASANFIDLQKQLSDVEDQIQLARRYYNGTTRDFNTKIQSFPDNILAKQFHFNACEFFAADDADKSVPQVDFTK